MTEGEKNKCLKNNTKGKKTKGRRWQEEKNESKNMKDAVRGSQIKVSLQEKNILKRGRKWEIIYRRMWASPCDQTDEQIIPSLNPVSKITTCEYLHSPVFPSKGKEARLNWFLRVNPWRVPTQQKKSWEELAEREREEIKPCTKKNNKKN